MGVRGNRAEMRLGCAVACHVAVSHVEIESKLGIAKGDECPAFGLLE